MQVGRSRDHAITKSRLDRDDPLAAGGDDRLDELVVGVLVAAIDELAEAVVAIGPLVVDAGEIERRRRGCGPGRITKRPAKRPAARSSASRRSAASNDGELLRGAAAEVARAPS